MPENNERMARCSYYGSSNIVDLKRKFKFACNYDCDKTIAEGGRHCKCERPSSDNEKGHGLPFFEACPDKPYDKFYCGCWGWD